MLENAGATTFSKCYNYYCKYSLLKKVSPTAKKKGKIKNRLTDLDDV